MSPDDGSLDGLPQEKVWRARAQTLSLDYVMVLVMFERTRLGRSGRQLDAIPTIRVVAGHGTGGQAAYEEVPAEPVGEGRFRVLATPGIAGGLAADDVVELDADGLATVVKRGGNLGIQVYSETHPADALETLIRAIEDLGGWLDGLISERAIALTVPVAAGLRRSRPFSMSSSGTSAASGISPTSTRPTATPH